MFDTHELWSIAMFLGPMDQVLEFISTLGHLKDMHHDPNKSLSYKVRIMASVYQITMKTNGT